MKKGEYILSNNRISWLDMSRGISIIFVVIVHSMLNQLKQQLFYFLIPEIFGTLAMGVCIFISGWVFEFSSKKYSEHKLKTTGNKFCRLMIPYFAFSAINYTIIVIATKIPALASIAQMGSSDYSQLSLPNFLYQTITYQNSTSRNLWFLYMLFLLNVLHIFLPKLMKNPIVTVVLFCLPVLQNTFELPVLLNYFCAYAGFFSLGRIAVSYEEKLFSVKKSVYTVIAILFLISAIVMNTLKFYGVFTGMASYAFIPVKFILVIGGIFTICCGCKFLEGTKADNIFTFFGRRSMEIYLMHFPFITQGSTALILKMFASVPPIFACIVGIILGLAIPVLVSDFVIKKIPLLSFILLGSKMKKRAVKK